MKTYVKVVGAVVAGIVLLGCADGEEATLDVAAEGSDAEDGSGQETTDATGEEDTTDATDDGEGASNLQPTDRSDDGGEDVSERDAAWPDPIALDVSGRTGAGFVVELFELRAEGSTIEVDVRVTNGQQTESRMNALMANELTALIDDLDNEYPLVPPVDDQDLTIGASEVVEGDLAFVGPLAPDATSLQLLINPGPFAGVRDGNNETEAPFVRIDDIPLTTDGA